MVQVISAFAKFSEKLTFFKPSPPFPLPPHPLPPPLIRTRSAYHECNVLKFYKHTKWMVSSDAVLVSVSILTSTQYTTTPNKFLHEIKNIGCEIFQLHWYNNCSSMRYCRILIKILKLIAEILVISP